MKSLRVNGSGDKKYEIVVPDGGKDPYCSCPAWKFHPKYDARSNFRTCKHIEAHRADVMRMVAEEIGCEVPPQQTFDFPKAEPPKKEVAAINYEVLL